MPHDRRSRRVLLAMLGLAGVAMCAGCARSSILRTSAGPLPELAPAGELHPDPGGAAAGMSSPTPPAAANPGGPAAGPPTGTPSMPRSTSGTPTPTSYPNTQAPASAYPQVGTEAANPSPPGAGSPSSIEPSSEAPTPADATTPLLDAELRRARAVTRQHFESLNAIETPTPLPDPIDPPAQVTATLVAETKPADPDPPLPPLAASARVAVDAGAPAAEPPIQLPPLMPVEASAPAAGSSAPVPMTPQPSATVDDPGPPADKPAAEAATVAESRRPSVAPDGEKPGETDRSAAVAEVQSSDDRPSPSPAPDRLERPRLEVAELKLCSRVKDFGLVEAIDHQQVPSGRLLLVYCEMAGLEYQPRGDAFVSRLAAHIELRSGSDGPVVWEKSPGTAEYTCNRRRRDYFVSYRIELPRTIEPGPYRLRLIQTDLVGNRVASREVPIMVVRSAGSGQ